MKFFQEIQQKPKEGMSRDNSDFKKQELQHELGHERNNIAININGKTWKVVPCKGTADSKEEWSHLNNMKSWAEKKSASTGKKWTVSLTGAPVSETVRSEVQQPVTENEDSPVLGAIIHRIMVGRTDLLAKYGPERIMAAAEDVADFAGDVEEIGSSDVSGWVKQVERMLKETPPEAFGEAGGKRPVSPDPQNYDSDWDYYNDRDEDEEEMKDDDVDYENMIDEASLAAMRDYFSRPDGNTVTVDTEYGAPERKQRANVPPEIQTLIDKMYRVGKITPQEFDILKRFQAKTGMKVGIKETDIGTGNQGYDSMLSVMKAVDAGKDATFDLGGESVTLEYPEARFLAGKYKAFLKAGRQEEFLKYMENPMAFDRLMKQLRDLIDKQKNFKGSVPGERGVEEDAITFAPLSKDQYLAQKKALQDIQLDPQTAKDPELRKELMSRTGALRKQAIASGHIAESLPKTNEGYYWCSLNKKSKLIPEGYKKIASGYITRK